MVSDAQLIFWLIGAAVYLVASASLVPFVAVAKGRSGLGWVFSALIFSPLLALIALAALPQGPGREPASPFEAELQSR